ncbi:MAG: hypothetical protein JO022_18915 [Acidobacteriaceae bacterium]|nr:hypothetical protein [Acidobacteriaceae bacterium]
MLDLFGSMSAALTEDPPNPEGFMKPIDRSFAGYDELKRNVKAMMLAAWVSSSIDFLKDEGDATKRTVELDWYMELRSKQEGGPFRQRRQVIRCELVKEGKRWRIRSLAPLSLFQP